MVVDELLEYVSPDDWVWVADRVGGGQIFYGWAKHVPERVGALEVGSVSGDQNIAGVIDIYVREER